jgi:hypothetical protein
VLDAAAVQDLNLDRQPDPSIYHTGDLKLVIVYMFRSLGPWGTTTK